ncbi:hypothetical protein A2704_00395 [Candidatus Kaiserbacteria bacterium RIFCSPHIGHO2_01_FULL_54_36b]|uniref:Peptidase S74 domain-containing protein n=1 Tax=Candidatus Kaiserbacteria bacterium RIFCSPHIGHO2_01_FULL_54_36b TaxID=1798483 RepID=A0A1F6CJG8_9BACT|nr:MAG: hypothetical protein A2704_00395 [Candidatus Kaiserbacteria bacterium RIFCSPHIGHO2_01_FULL_54_36b]
MNASPNELQEQDPKPLVTSTTAAGRFGVTNDYITQLCRRKVVMGSLVGRVWHVEPESLERYLTHARAESVANRAARAEQLKQEYKAKQVLVAAPEEKILKYEVVVPAALPPAPVKSVSSLGSLFAHQVLALSAAMALIISGTVYATERELPLVAEFKASYQKALSALPELSSALSILNLQKSANTAALSLAPIQNFFCSRFNLFCPQEDASTLVAKTPVTEAPAPPAESSMIYHTEREDSMQSTGSSIYGTTPASPTVVNNTYPVIERVTETKLVGGLSVDVLAVILGELNKDIRSDFTTIVGNSVGGSVENISTGLALSDLTDANIPDTITASNYLALTGGTLTGGLTGTSLTLSGDLTVSGAQTLSGAITIPYLTATSTTASSFIQASTTRLSVFDTAYFGGTSTTTISNIGSITLPSAALLTAPYASSTAFSVSGIGYFGTASTTAFNLSGTATLQSISADSLLYNNSSQQLTAATIGGSLSLSGGQLALNVGNGNTWTALQSFTLGASTTQLSALDALYVGRTATTTIRGDGVASVLPYASSTALTVSGTGYFGLGAFTNTSGTTTIASGQGFTIGDSQFVVQQGSGNVGIGTTSPSFIDGWTNGLHIAGAIPAIRLEDSDDANNQTWQLGINLAGDFAIDAEGIANLSTVFLIDRDQGSVGIGTTTPWGKLSVEMDTTNPAFVVSNTGSTTPAFYIGGVNQNGNVGIGTESPGANLHVHGTNALALADDSETLLARFRDNFVDGANNNYFDIVTRAHATRDNSWHNSALRLEASIDDNSSAQSWIEFRHGASTASDNTIAFGEGSGDANTWLVIDDGNVGIGTTSPKAKLQIDLGDLLFSGSTHSIGTDFDAFNNGIAFADSNNTGERAALITGTKTGTWGGNLQFITRPNAGGAALERMRIDNAGNVGIGTTTPETKLNIEGTALSTFTGTTDGHLRIQADTGSNQYTVLDFASRSAVSAGSHGIPKARIGSQVTSSGSYLHFGTSNLYSSGITNTAMTIDYSGNVGIGTTSPAVALHVDGTTAATSRIRITRSGTHAEFAVLNGNAIVAGASGISLYTGSGDISGVTEKVTINSTGNVGINDTTPTEGLLTVGGTLYVLTNTAVGADPLCWDGAGGSLYGDCTSLAQYKENVEDISLGLDAVLALTPREFDWREDFGGEHDLGFIAEEIVAVSPLLARYDNETGELQGVKYERLTALLAKAIQELNLKFEDLATTTPATEQGSFPSRFFSSLFTRLTQWFADAGNGIADFFAKRVRTDELCVGATCVNEAELQQLLDLRSQSAAAGGSSTPAPAPAPSPAPDSTSSPQAESEPPPEAQPAGAPEEADEIEEPTVEDVAPSTPSEPVEEAPAPEETNEEESTVEESEEESSPSSQVETDVAAVIQ